MSEQVFGIRMVNYILATLVIILGFLAVFIASQALSLKIKQTQNSGVIYEVMQPDEDVIIASTIGPWTYQCVQSPQRSDSCSASQIIRNNLDDVSLDLHVTLIRRGDVIIPRFKIQAPLGVYLPAGLTVELPNQKPFNVPFQFCQEKGCFINLDLADNVVAQLKENSVMIVGYHDVNRVVGYHEVNLSGVSDILTRLRNNQSSE